MKFSATQAGRINQHQQPKQNRKHMKVKDVQHGKTTRKSFAQMKRLFDANLIEVQKSYESFLDKGLREVFGT